MFRILCKSDTVLELSLKSGSLVPTVEKCISEFKIRLYELRPYRYNKHLKYGAYIKCKLSRIVKIEHSTEYQGGG